MLSSPSLASGCWLGRLVPHGLLFHVIPAETEHVRNHADSQDGLAAMLEVVVVLAARRL